MSSMFFTGDSGVCDSTMDKLSEGVLWRTGSGSGGGNNRNSIGKMTAKDARVGSLKAALENRGRVSSSLERSFDSGDSDDDNRTVPGAYDIVLNIVVTEMITEIDRAIEYQSKSPVLRDCIVVSLSTTPSYASNASLSDGVFRAELGEGVFDISLSKANLNRREKTEVLKTCEGRADDLVSDVFDILMQEYAAREFFVQEMPSREILADLSDRGRPLRRARVSWFVPGLDNARRNVRYDHEIDAYIEGIALNDLFLSFPQASPNSR